jgi:hypothetical protein
MVVIITIQMAQIRVLEIVELKQEKADKLGFVLPF